MSWSDRIDICRKIGEYYGLSDRLCMLMEECGELTQAANKVRRACFQGENYENIDMKVARSGLIEEIADVSCLIEEVKCLLEISGSEVTGWMDKKLDKMTQRIELRETKKGV